MRTCKTCGSTFKLAGAKVSIPPTPTKPINASAIRTTLLSIDSDLSQLNGEIHHVQALLDELLRKRQLLHNASEQHKALIAPIQCLPHEMLSKIFIDSLPDDWKDEISTFRRAVMLPGNVCQYWRNIALSTPQLWVSISLQLNIVAEADIDFVRTWLTRSGSLPLFLNLEEEFVHDPIILHPVVNILIEHAERWAYVDFALTPTTLNHIHSIKSCLVELHTLKIAPPPWYYESTKRWVTSIHTFEDAPRLTNLTVGHSVILNNHAVPWIQLTTIRMDVLFSIEECCDVLLWAPNLLEYCLRPYAPDGNVSRAVVHHTSLRTLEIFCYIHREAQSILLDRLSLPALLSFKSDTDGSTKFTSLLTRSRCSLQKLDLPAWDRRLEDEELIQCLCLMPCLTHLQLDNNRILPLLARPHLTLQDNQTSYLLPKLESISLRLSSWDSGSVVADIIDSRRMSDNGAPHTNLSPLKTVRLYLGSYRAKISPSTMSRLCDHARDGLDIRTKQWLQTEYYDILK